jgi:hypothetical protein
VVRRRSSREAIGLRACASRIRQAIPAIVEHAVSHGDESPDVDDARLPESFHELDEGLDELGWEAEEARIAYVRANRAEIIASLEALRGTVR